MKIMHLTRVAPRMFNCCVALLLALTGGCQKTVVSTGPVTTNVAGPAIPGWPPTGPQPKLPVIQLFINGKMVDAEVAMRGIEIMTGMMFRTNLGVNEGMLFVLPQANQASFYMTNCYVPLQVAYIDPAGTILELHELKAHDATPVYSQATNIHFVLEMNTGWFTRNNISTGAVIRTQLGTLPNAFVPAPRNAPANPP